METVSITRSIIYKCYALKMPQSFSEKTANYAKIIPLYDLEYTLCVKLADEINKGNKSTSYWIDRLENYGKTFIRQLRSEIEEANHDN